MSASYDDLFGSSSDSDSLPVPKKAVPGTNPPRGSFGVRSQGRGRWTSSRGRGSRFQRGGAAQEPVIVPNWPTGDLIDSVELGDLQPENVAPTVSEVHYAASYNLLDGQTPVILVPGCPARWSPISSAPKPKLQQDAGDYYRDINSAHFPIFPTEPAIRSLLSLQPKYDCSSIDVVACGSTLGNLVRFVRGISNPFRFDIDSIGQTVFFIRKENSPTEVIDGIYGYGHTFPEAYTTWDRDVAGSCSHQRIIQYKFGNLRYLVRSESDGYLPDEHSQSDKSQISPVHGTGQSTVAPADDLALPDAARLTISSRKGQNAVGGSVELHLQGRRVSQAQVFDLKTRSIFNAIQMDEILPRLWVSQVSKFILAYHNRGTFEKIDVEDVKEDVQAWERDNARALERVDAVVRWIIEESRGSTHMEVSWLGTGPLILREQLGTPRLALPADLRSRWTTQIS